MMQNPEPSQSTQLSDSPELRPAERSVVVRLWIFVSSTLLGVILVLSLAVTYGVFTLVERATSDAPLILPPTGSLYAHWTVVTLTFAAMVNLLFATVRIPVKWDRAGAWCSHLGLMFLAVGSVYFWQVRTEGQCYISRGRDDSWPVVRHFFQSTDKVACHVYDTAKMQSRSTLPPTIQTIFDSPSGRVPVDIDVNIDGVPEGVSIKATRIYPRAELRQQWLEDASTLTPAVEVQVTHGRQVDRTIMCQAYEDTYQFNMPECMVMFQARKAITQDDINQRNAALKPTSRPSQEFFAIFYDGRAQPVLLIGDSSGKLSRRPFLPGQSVSTSQGDHPTSIKLILTIYRARRGMKVDIIPADMPGRTSASIELTVKSGSKTVKRQVPYGAYLSGRPTTINLPSGQKLYIAFSQPWLELPEPIQITGHEFKTAPASRMPEDYICDIAIGTGVQVRNETLKLNFPITVGPYRLHQSTWQPKQESPSDYNDPSAIVLGVADRPGILLVFIGSFMLCAGFPFAFYIKPMILAGKLKRRAS